MWRFFRQSVGHFGWILVVVSKDVLGNRKRLALKSYELISLVGDLRTTLPCLGAWPFLGILPLQVAKLELKPALSNNQTSTSKAAYCPPHCHCFRWSQIWLFFLGSVGDVRQVWSTCRLNWLLSTAVCCSMRLGTATGCGTGGEWCARCQKSICRSLPQNITAPGPVWFLVMFGERAAEDSEWAESWVIVMFVLFRYCSPGLKFCHMQFHF